MTLRAIELTWPGVPVTAWASIALEVEDAGRDVARLARVVEKAVRTSVRACSSTTESRRFHITCRRMSDTERRRSSSTSSRTIWRRWR